MHRFRVLPIHLIILIIAVVAIILTGLRTQATLKTYILKNVCDRRGGLSYNSSRMI